VSLLDLPVYQQRWKDYHEAPAFEFVDEITIVGKLIRPAMTSQSDQEFSSLEPS